MGRNYLGGPSSEDRYTHNILLVVTVLWRGPVKKNTEFGGLALEISCGYLELGAPTEPDLSGTPELVSGGKF